jgi:hypothetical protein
MTDESQGTLVPPATETPVKALAAWDALAARIAAAEHESASKVFDYDDRHDLAAARSWVAQLRRIKGSIERTRKDAKSIHLERGRLVDATAKTLESSVAGLIQPHQEAIERIEAIEQARVDGHRSVLVYIEGLSAGVTTSAEALERLEALEALDVSGLEEFHTAAENRVAEQTERLQGIYGELIQREADAAELEALRAEKDHREAEEAAEALRLEGEQRAEARLAAERQEQVALDYQPEAGHEQEEALQQGVPAEGDYRDHSTILQRRSVYQPPARSQAQEEEVPMPSAPAEKATPQRRPIYCSTAPARSEADAAYTRSCQIAVLVACLKGKTATQVATALLDGTFHRAVTVHPTQL